MQPDKPTAQQSPPDFAAELARERACWRANLLRAIRPVTAVLALLGLLAVTFLMRDAQRLWPMAGFSVLLLASILPRLGTQVRAWLIIVSLTTMCILGMTFFGPAPNLYTGTLVAVAFAFLLLDRRQALVVCVLAGLGVIAMGIAFVGNWTVVSPHWPSQLDVTRPANVIRILVLFFLAATMLTLGMLYVLRTLERLLREKSEALVSLRAQTVAKEGLQREVAVWEKTAARARELEFLGRLAGYFGHDTNNALLIVWSSLDVLKDPLATAPQKADAITALSEAANHIRDIASQLRAFGPGRKTSAGSADLRAVVQSTVRMLRQILPSGVFIAVGDIAPVRIAMEASELQRILTNLALNASDAMRDQGMLAIGARTVPAEDLANLGLSAKEVAAIHIADTGTGIPAAVKARMFEPFFTTKGNRGSGLGLSSVKESIEASGGAIKVDSELGQGTTFTLFLPATAAARVRDRTHEVPVNAGAVLVVEEALVQAAIVRALRSHCLVALGASSAAEAIELLQSTPESVVLLVAGDLSQPDRRELVEALRRKSPHARVVCCVDESLDDDEIALPATELYKPFTLPELLKVVEQELTAVAEASARHKKHGRG